ncbi:RcnB family protein [Massilia sp. TWR1-2-2]|uniref:RcnB family protein n=1 Tax=Massilia sp. TWR1-2-2 TaxID=2804584 RepID=UPI003CEC6949
MHGAYLAQEYRGSRYVVNDWRGRHLSAPPRGYHWVQANNTTCWRRSPPASSPRYC